MKNTKLFFAAAVVIFSLVAAPVLMAQGIMGDMGEKTTQSTSDADSSAQLDSGVPAETGGASSVEANTVAEVKTFEDAAEVILMGNIADPAGDGKYVFTDKTGSINIEIPEEILSNAEIAGEVPVVIFGEVDILDAGIAEINVIQIEKLM